jgi:hypothetical protein
MLWKRLVAVSSMLLFVALFACGAHSVPVSQSRLEAVPADGAGETFWLFADSQLHHAVGVQTRNATPFVDMLAEHAIRPMSVDLWSDVLLQGVVAAMRKEPAVAIFLGDAANLSCVGELTRFYEATKGLRWFGVLGNHDGFYFGNSAVPADAYLNAARYTWQGACDKDFDTAPAHDTIKRIKDYELSLLGQHNSNIEQGTATKAVALLMYLDALERFQGIKLSPSPWNRKAWQAEKDAELGTGGNRWVYRGTATYLAPSNVELRYSIVASMGQNTYKPEPHASSKENAKRQDTGSRSWAGYLFQDVELPGGAHVFLLDTSDFAVPPNLERNICKLPGKCGRVGAHQLAELTKAANGATSKQRGYFIAGHHHWGGLSISAAAALRPFVKRTGFITYLSGHTHAATSSVGYMAVPSQEDSRVDLDYDWEINTASITDTPMEFTKLHYWKATNTQKRRLEVDVRKVRDLFPGRCFLVDVDSEAAEGEADAEMNYGSTKKRVRRGLGIYLRLFQRLNDGIGLSDDCDSVCTTNKLKAMLLPRYRPGRIRLRVPFVLDDARVLLRDLIFRDRTRLRTQSKVTQMEASCAIWASDLEGKKNKAGHPTSGGNRFPPRSVTPYAVEAK